MSAIVDIAAERRRQVEVEGWTPEHDDEHSGGEMALAAASYAYAAGLPETWREDSRKWGSTPGMWPWAMSSFKLKDRRRDLVRAAALILAEIERLDRHELRRAGP